MLLVAAILFTLGAMGGIFLATLHIKKRQVPVAIALVHGTVAATALVILAITVVSNGGPNLARAALGFFAVAALGGITLFVMHLRKKPLPLLLILGHGSLGAIGLIFLLSQVVINMNLH